MRYREARFYRPRYGRFIHVDPVYAGLFDPQQWNRYTYARANPLSFMDPDGRCTSSITNSKRGLRLLVIPVVGRAPWDPSERALAILVFICAPILYFWVNCTLLVRSRRRLVSAQGPNKSHQSR